MVTIGNMTVDLLPMPALLIDLGFLMFAVALLWYAQVLGDLLDVIRKPPLEALVVIAAWVIILAFVVPHYLLSAFFAPNVTAGVDMYQWLWLLRTFSFFGLFIAAALVLYPSVSYYLWTR